MTGCKSITSLAVVAIIIGSSCSTAQALPKQVSNPTECLADGISDTSQYRSYVPVPGTSSFLPVYSSVDLTKPLQVASLLIFVHGVGGDANTFFCDAFKAVPASVGIIVPWFGDEQVQLSTWAGNTSASPSAQPATAGSLHWRGSGWNQGAAAANDASISSFAALDALIDLVSKTAAQGRLKQVVTAGFSAGAQMVQRYAWASTYSTGSSPPVKFAVSDPSTYLYFDTRRPEQSCRPHSDTGLDWSCSKFRRYSAESAGCNNFNRYKLGLEGLSEASPYFSQQRFRSSTATVSTAYLQKDILYVFGGADTCNCQTKGYENPASCIRASAEATSGGCRPSVAGPTCCDMPQGKRTNSFVDVNCGGMLQGSNRLQRGLLYMDYLKLFSNSQLSPKFVVVPGMGHDQVPMLKSAEFQTFVSP